MQVNEQNQFWRSRQDVETVFGMARLIEKIQPTSKFEGDDTKDQEAIVLCRVLTSLLAWEAVGDYALQSGLATASPCRVSYGPPTCSAPLAA